VPPSGGVFVYDGRCSPTPHRDHLGNLLPALRALHPGRERRERHGLPYDPRERFRLDMAGGAALAHHAQLNVQAPSALASRLLPSIDQEQRFTRAGRKDAVLATQH